MRAKLLFGFDMTSNVRHVVTMLLNHIVDYHAFSLRVEEPIFLMKMSLVMMLSYNRLVEALRDRGGSIRHARSGAKTVELTVRERETEPGT